ncbi:MAG: proton-conducting transporter membrane subunit, partial [Fervidicoccaceae archaeon]
LQGFAFNGDRKKIVMLSLIFGLLELGAVSYISYLTITSQFSSALNGIIVYDGFAVIPMMFGAFILQLVLSSTALEFSSPQKMAIFSSSSFMVMLGSFLLATSSSIALFISAWLLLSISSYTAIAASKTKTSSDASIKYALMGAMSTVFIVMWLGTGIYLPGDNIYSASWYGSGKLLLLASAFLIAGVGFKLGIVPFQWWMPDVYSSAEGKAIALITGVAKMGAILGFTRMIYYTFYIGPSYQLILFIAAISILTMTFGNIAALTTNIFPRILAYSSIAQIGYILVGVVGMLYGASTGDEQLIYLASGGIAVQTIGYGLSKSGAFLFSGELGIAAQYEKIKGLYKSDSSSTASLALFLLSLLGLPPLIGFWGKLYLFESAISYSLVLVLIAIINSGISSFYYGRLISALFSDGSSSDQKMKLKTSYIALSILILLLGLGIIQLLFPYLKIKPI